MLESTVKAKLRKLAKDNEFNAYHYPNNGRGVKGFPDYICYSKTGKHFLVEVKTDKGKMSAGQIEFKNHIEGIGVKYFIYRGCENDDKNILDYISQ